MRKKIFISGTPLLSFTSGTPMRGIVDALIRFYPKYDFLIEFPNSDRNFVVTKFENQFKSLPNVNILKTRRNIRWENLKKLFKLQKYHSWPKGFDCYISPGIPESFSTSKNPSISFIADLSSVNQPEISSLKWHGNRIFKNLLNQAVESNNKLVAISEFTKNELNERYPKHQSKFIRIYNGIESFWFDDHYEQNILTNSLFDQNYWIWWGFISNRKNILRLLQAYLIAKQKDDTLPKIVFVGELNPDQAVCLDLINLYPQYFEIHKFQDPYILKSLVKNSNGLLFPSLYEGFGLPVIEAFSQGIPVLHSSITSLPEISNGLGFGVNPYEIHSIANGLLEFSSAVYDQEIVAIRKEFASNFTYQKAADKLAIVIDYLVNK